MWLSSDNSNQSVVIDAEPEEVWEQLVDGSWLQDDRETFVETVEEHRRLVWWWGDDEAGYSRVEIELEPLVSGTRVVVTESFPLHALTACLTPA
jgi:uncharacterized protein YndB with AHSA1/START domain